MRAAHGVGVDRDLETLKIARVNATRHGLGDRAGFVCASCMDGLSGEFDIIVSNPPYICSEEISLLEPEVALFDPRDALDGGHDGLDAYRWIIPQLAQHLKPEGWALFEVGDKQAVDVCILFQAEGGGNGFGELRRVPDLAGHIRCIAAQRSSCH
jgi:release factor glutamine methyltransferase